MKMYKYILFAFILSILYTYLQNIQGNSVSLLSNLISFIALSLMFCLMSNPELNILKRFGIGIIVAIVLGIIMFLIFLIDKRVFNYCVDLSKFRIFYKP
jgi:hypothetical protein